MSLSRIARPIVVILAIVGCQQRSEKAAQSTNVASTDTANVVCTRPVLIDDDRSAFVCSGGAASRTGDTLHLRLAHGETTLVDTKDEAALSYRYVGRIGLRRLHLVGEYGGERPPRFLLVDPESGHSIEAPAMPVLSPDTLRFAAAIAQWDCDESPEQRLEIWRFTDSVPELEWRLNKFRCGRSGAASGWAATAPVWRSPDTLDFTRHQGSPPDQGTAGRAAHDARGWRLLVPSG